MLLRKRGLPFLIVPSAVFTGSLLVALRRAAAVWCGIRDEDADFEMDSVTANVRSVCTISSHSQRRIDGAEQHAP